MLAGRKLLLADDSVTIQKVIDLTFADEGVRVIAFDNGQDALDHLEEVGPDVILADVFMPFKSGYEVCEYVKKNEKLKHIPVMLLVGSFEPFDEAEARRVGADDILTKPFQSIRRLIERVGALVGKPPAEPEVPTAELPKPEDAIADEQMLSTQEIEITTADTRPLPEGVDVETALATQSALVKESAIGEETMETGFTELSDESPVDANEALLDLGDYEPRSAAVTDDFVLDLDLEDTLGGHTGEPVSHSVEPARMFVEPSVVETSRVNEFAYQQADVSDEVVTAFAPVEEVAYEDQVHQVTIEPAYASSQESDVVVTQESDVVATGGTANLGAVEVTPHTLSPEMIDAIARRAVELMSEKVVREIAWEVVPDLAELLIKRRLEEQESQPK